MFVLCINQKKLRKKYTITKLNQYNYEKWILYLWTQKIKTPKPHILILKLADKLDLRRCEISIASTNLSIYYTWKHKKLSQQ